MGAVHLEDLSGQIELVVFPRLYQSARALLAPDSIVLVRAKVDTRNDTPQLVCDAIEAFDPDKPLETIQVASPPRKTRARTSDNYDQADARRASRNAVAESRPDSPLTHRDGEADDVSASSVREANNESAQIAGDPVPARSDPPAQTRQSGARSRRVTAGEVPSSGGAFQRVSGRDGRATVVPETQPTWDDDPWAGIDVVSSTPEAAPIPDPRSVPPVPASAAHSGGSELSGSPSQDFAEAHPNRANTRDIATNRSASPTHEYSDNEAASSASAGGVTIDQISVIDVTLTRDGREARDLRAVERLDVTLRKWPGTVPVVVRLLHANGTSVAIAASHRVDPCRDLIESLQREVGFDQVLVRGGKPASAAPNDAFLVDGRVSA
jgi:hypothetical protein